jgi:hypothetical protein
MIPWAKGFIASQVLNAHLVGPSWGLNRRRYWRNFKTSRLDFVGEELLRLLPHEAFAEEDYYDTGVADYGEALRVWALRKNLTRKRHFVVTVGGMDGGYLAIESAHAFLWSRLLNSRNALSNIFKVRFNVSQQKLLIAVHMRLGDDFADAEVGRDIRSRFNVRVPISWYRGLCEALRREFSGQIQFLFFTDRETPEYLRIVSEYNPDQIRNRQLSECSDLILMATADLRICSVSSYSLAACFLSRGPYVWYEPQLCIDHGVYSLWGHEPRQQRAGSPTRLSASKVESISKASDFQLLGYPVGLDSLLPDSLVNHLHIALAKKDPRMDLIQYGCVPLGAAVPASESILGREG